MISYIRTEVRRSCAVGHPARDCRARSYRLSAPAWHGPKLEMRPGLCIYSACRDGCRRQGIANAGDDSIGVDACSEDTYVERDRPVICQPAEAAEQVRPVVL